MIDSFAQKTVQVTAALLRHIQNITYGYGGGLARCFFISRLVFPDPQMAQLFLSADYADWRRLFLTIGCLAVQGAQRLSTSFFRQGRSGFQPLSALFLSVEGAD
jgi:hypothetical protein